MANLTLSDSLVIGPDFDGGVSVVPKAVSMTTRSSWLPRYRGSGERIGPLHGRRA
jgi:hypothetical protein